jgi:hypothetical protein
VNARYVECRLEDIPDGITFHVLPQDQGQIVEVAWGDFGNAEHGPGDPFKRIVDRSEGPTPTYYQRVES